MNIYISDTDSRIYTSEPLHIQCYFEYEISKIGLILVYPIDFQVPSEKKLERLLLIPFTHGNNLWHLTLHLYTTYKYSIEHNLEITDIFPIFFEGFYSRNASSPETIYKDLLFNGMGFNYENFVEIRNIFRLGKYIRAERVDYVDSSIEFNNEPLFNNFKEFVMKNLKVQYSTNIYEKRVTFILRRGTREIMNIDEVREKLSRLPTKINYIYLEDYSIREQLEILANTHLLIGMHGAGLTWGIFMKTRSIMIEMFPGNASSNDYRNWCRVANIQYNSLGVDIKEGSVEDFRNCRVVLNNKQIGEIKRKCLINQ